MNGQTTYTPYGPGRRCGTRTGRCIASVPAAREEARNGRTYRPGHILFGLTRCVPSLHVPAYPGGLRFAEQGHPYGCLSQSFLCARSSGSIPLPPIPAVPLFVCSASAPLDKGAGSPLRVAPSLRSAAWESIRGAARLGRILFPPFGGFRLWPFRFSGPTISATDEQVYLLPCPGLSGGSFALRNRGIPMAVYPGAPSVPAAGTAFLCRLSRRLRFSRALRPSCSTKGGGTRSGRRRLCVGSVGAFFRPFIFPCDHTKNI